MSDRRVPDLSTDADSGYRRGGARVSEARAAPSFFRQIGMNVIIAILLGGLVLCGWFIANQQQVIVQERDRVDLANARLLKLEARLIATDDAVSQEGQDTKQQINLWESEIRKLWSVANERNKKWIQDNQKAVAKITKSLTGIEATARDLNASVGRHEEAFTQQQTILDELASVKLQLQQMLRGQRELVDKTNVANQAVASLRASLSGQVRDNSEAVASMDAYRLAMNARIADLERRLLAFTSNTGP
ncbi:MAG: hypothetical protein HN856_08970 [Gammaproteobacteria bacterium]|jgi:hypothetical protein|nr:hypothetical protein [Gammaproteobacteria bacterium]MCH1551591.1 hypothetical protein [Pseudomonadales bacterium]